MIEFTYIIGGNLELQVMANEIKPEAEVNFKGDIEIVSVKTPQGLDFETSDIAIIGRDGNASDLDEILKIEAMERQK